VTPGFGLSHNETVRNDVLAAAAANFGVRGDVVSARPWGRGLIHESWTVDAPPGRILLQRLNRTVFPDPALMAENAASAAVRVDGALRRAGDLEPRHRLVFLAGPDGRPWYRDDRGDVWRASRWIEHSRMPDSSRPAELRRAAAALGRFPGLVAGGKGPEPAVVLPRFHDTRRRVAVLRESLETDRAGRLGECRVECKRLLDLADIAERLTATELPTRFVHNDAKLDNVLVDETAGEVLCVVDLDTVMPGLAAHDFGDLVRSAVSGRAEDETDLETITVREQVFRNLAAGYLEGASGWITDGEREVLVDGAIVLTYEQAVRFLADFLDGDAYFRVEEPAHNLRRARAQLHLLEELLIREADLVATVARL
jgi:hypothetical protein